MGRADDCRPGLAREGGQERGDRAAVRLVEAGGRLVREQERRPARQRARDGDALALARREVLDPPARALAQADLGERLRRGRAAAAPQSEPELDVLEAGQERNETRILADERDPVAAEARPAPPARAPRPAGR